MDAVPLRPLQRSMSRESTETSRLVNPERSSQERHQQTNYDDDDDGVDDFRDGQ